MSDSRQRVTCVENPAGIPMPSDEAALRQSLATTAAAYPAPVGRIELIETHISWVFLAGDFAYKIKKPVNLGFVDFSTLDRRRHFCEEELRLNRRLAPELYLDVLPITGSPAAPRITDSGTPFEYCVRMKRFAQDRLLSRLIVTGELLPQHIDALAQQVSEFHSRIPIAESASPFGTPDAVADPVRANFRYYDQPKNASIQKRIDHLRTWTEDELASCRNLLEARKRDGFVRECHGDMHLGNMILVDDSITIFDCIEFSASLRWIDVMSEIAFCTMDLVDRGRADLARRLCNGYLEWSGDYSGLAVFPLYFTYRALVRAKVAHLRRAQGELPNGQVDRLSRELANYIDLADQSTHQPTPFLATTYGVSGSGKTRGSQVVIERLGVIRIRSDLERKRLAGFAPRADTGSGIASGLYSSAHSRRTFDKLAELAATIIRAGFPAIVDATFLQRSDRERFQRLAESLEVPFVILDFPADEALCRERIRRRRDEGADASEANDAVLDRQIEMREPLTEMERSFAVTFDGEHPEMIDRAIAKITGQREQ
jgi:uncharacterized protein